MVVVVVVVMMVMVVVIVAVVQYLCGPGSVVGIATSYGLGIKSR
jgi:hypothetical protein